MSNVKIANIFISRPIQAINQDEAEIAKIGPEIRRLANKIFQGRISIQKGNNSIFGI